MLGFYTFFRDLLRKSQWLNLALNQNWDPMSASGKKPGKLARLRARRMAKSLQQQGILSRAQKALPTFLAGLVIITGLVGAFVLWRSPSVLPVAEEEVRFFQIATGSVGGTYFPVGKAIAGVISKPPGDVSCEKGGKCGVDGLIAIAKAAPGSVANVRAVSGGTVESAFAQADIVTWAYEGKGPFEKDGKFKNLRVIASLYPEAVHLVVTKKSGIKRIEDLRGKRVSIDRVGSGTRIDALLILKAYGVSQKDITAHSVDASQASDLMLSGDLDAYFLIAGTPSLVISDLSERSKINLIPISGPPAARLKSKNSYFITKKIAAGTYKGLGEIETLSVQALWITNVKTNRKLVGKILTALWRDENRKTLLQGHAKMSLITPQSAIEGIAIPIHRGARDYYIKQGILKR